MSDWLAEEVCALVAASWPSCIWVAAMAAPVPFRTSVRLSNTRNAADQVSIGAL
jgi:hypothetical protein